MSADPDRDARVARIMRNYENQKAAIQATHSITNALMLVYAAPVIGVGVGALIAIVLIAIVLIAVRLGS